MPPKRNRKKLHKSETGGRPPGPRILRIISNYPRGQAPLPRSEEKTLIDSYFGLIRLQLGALATALITTVWFVVTIKLSIPVPPAVDSLVRTEVMPYLGFACAVVVWGLSVGHVKNIGEAVEWTETRTTKMVWTLFFYNVCLCPCLASLVCFYIAVLAGRRMKQLGIPSQPYGFSKAECYAFLRAKASKEEPPMLEPLP